MLRAMKRGSVVVDLAASALGGGVANSKPGRVVTFKTDAGSSGDSGLGGILGGTGDVKIVGYTDMPSRTAALASTAFGDNVASFILSAGPSTQPEICKGCFYVDYADPAVR
jgi:NAD/NADP transhydrogenase alpha subunit